MISLYCNAQIQTYAVIQIPFFRNMRGGRVVFQNIQKPNTDDWTSALDAVESSLELEKSVHESLLALHRNADEQSDAQLTDFLEGEYLKEQVNLKNKI